MPADDKRQFGDRGDQHLAKRRGTKTPTTTRSTSSTYERLTAPIPPQASELTQLELQAAVHTLTQQRDDALRELSSRANLALYVQSLRSLTTDLVEAVEALEGAVRKVYLHTKTIESIHTAEDEEL